MLNLFPLNVLLLVCLTHWSSLPQLAPEIVKILPRQTGFHLAGKETQSQRGVLPKISQIVGAGGEE